MFNSSFIYEHSLITQMLANNISLQITRKLEDLKFISGSQKIVSTIQYSLPFSALAEMQKFLIIVKI